MNSLAQMANVIPAILPGYRGASILAASLTGMLRTAPDSLDYCIHQAAADVAKRWLQAEGWESVADNMELLYVQLLAERRGMHYNSTHEVTP